MFLASSSLYDMFLEGFQNRKEDSLQEKKNKKNVVFTTMMYLKIKLQENTIKNWNNKHLSMLAHTHIYIHTN